MSKGKGKGKCRYKLVIKACKQAFFKNMKLSTEKQSRHRSLCSYDVVRSVRGFRVQLGILHKAPFGAQKVGDSA